jgi:hypothetical protein
MKIVGFNEENPARAECIGPLYVNPNARNAIRPQYAPGHPSP